MITVRYDLKSPSIWDLLGSNQKPTKEDLKNYMDKGDKIFFRFCDVCKEEVRFIDNFCANCGSTLKSWNMCVVCHNPVEVGMICKDTKMCGGKNTTISPKQWIKEYRFMPFYFGTLEAIEIENEFE